MPNNPANYFITDLMPEVNDQFQRLKDAVVMNRAKNPELKAILVTSEAHGDGASTVAINLALALAGDGKSKVLLIDGNLRQPIIHSAFNLEDGEGLAELLLGKAEPEQIIQSSFIPNVSVITAGKIRSRPTQLLNLERLAELLGRFKQDFDFLVIDGSPVNKYSDSVVLATHVDAAILVMVAEGTKWHALKWAKEQLEQKGVPILGVVMNRRKYYIPQLVFRRFFI